jgi:hypothetical protein
MQTLKARFPDGDPKEHPEAAPDKHDIWVRRSASRVYVVLGATHDMMDKLVAETTFDP